MSENLKVCIGSQNPTKINAVDIAFKIVFENYDLYTISADSKVSNQPIGFDEIIQGAVNRATQALNYLEAKKEDNDALLGVGLESGLVKIPQANSKYMDFQYCAIIDENDYITLGTGNAFEHPQFVIDEILSKDNAEVGIIMGRLAINLELKNTGGAISFLSKNIIKRTDILSNAVICALLPRINVELYNIYRRIKADSEIDQNYLRRNKKPWTKKKIHDTDVPFIN